MRKGPLVSLKIVEFAGIGPAPFCGMLLSDLGADVIRIDRAGHVAPIGIDPILGRGRRSVALDLKSKGGVETCLRLIERADAAFEGFRPGVMERLGLGPEVLLARNPKLVFGRMTGWGQDGPYAHTAGHDLNYIALTGALHAIGMENKPTPPLNLVGDFGGGALYLALGLIAAVLHARQTGQGQVIDCAMVDGASSLMSFMYAAHGAGQWTDDRRSNMLDGGLPYYDTYRCADGGWISIAALEPQFFKSFCEITGRPDSFFQAHNNPAAWPAMREDLTQFFLSKTRDEWCALFEGTDVCFAPILSMEEAPHHPHIAARETFLHLDGLTQPAPAPRFSATPGAVQGPAPEIGADTQTALADWGVPTQL